MNKLLVICGQTATGKTSLALELAEKLNGELVSADSRQVYKSMDIGTGKDIPKDFKFRVTDLRIKDYEIGFYTDKNVRLWGYDLVGPDQDFNVSDYAIIARKIIRNIWRRKNLPILVGGTGLYIKAVIDGMDTMGFERNEELRNILKDKSCEELLSVLGKLDLLKVKSLNESDRKNPRRLIRAIEIAQSRKLDESVGKKNKLQADTLFIGMKAPKNELVKKIRKRVKKRFERGFLEEVELLLKKGVKWSYSSMSSTGYRQTESYILGKKTLKNVLNDWVTAEVQYAKRQLTWFKKEKRITWFDVSDKKYRVNVENIVRRWYFK